LKEGCRLGCKVLVTGGAGFIGSHLVDSLLEDNYQVLVIDNFDPFYSRRIKEENIVQHRQAGHYSLVEADIRDRAKVMEIIRDWRPEKVIHLAAKAGVRPSVEEPFNYVDVNITGTTNLLDASVKYGVGRFVFASSSSVYGLNKKVPFAETDPVLQPASPYGATKLAGEALCNSYSNCSRLPVVALRFFTVYGPRQRPDLAIHKFARKILKGEPVPFFGDGNTSRDYTYISDIISGIRAAMSYQGSGYEVFNLGNDQPVKLIDLVCALEEVLGKKAVLERRPLQAGDVPQTWASIEKAKKHLGYLPKTKLKEGLGYFTAWLQR